MTYETDEEKVEAIKKWWKENGVAVVAGITLGLIAIFGWRFWSDYRDNIASQASSAFEQLLASARSGRADAVAKQSEILDEDYASTPYATLGALVAAKVLYEKGDSVAAIAKLEQVVTTAPDPALSRLAALRLARIQIADGQLDAAAATIEAHDDSPDFTGDFAAVRGDLAAARGDFAAARSAYEKAIEAGSGLSELIRLKLDNLPSAS